MTTISITTNLVVETCWCGIQHAVPEHMVTNMRTQQREGRKQDGIYCPLGHTWVFTGPSKVDELQKALTQANSRLTAAQDQLRSEELRRDRAEKELKRQAKRASAGVCPCCKRSFVQLKRHMDTKHPEHGS